MADLLLPAEKGGQQQEALRSCTEKTNFVIYFWTWVTLVPTFEIWLGRVFNMEISILESKNTFIIF
jgi:hypothetical protein